MRCSRSTGLRRARSSLRSSGPGWSVWPAPWWGPRTILFWLEREGVVAVPGRTSVERCLVRHGLVTPQARRRKRSDYKRWERSRAMELWQMDVVGGVRLVDGSEAKIVSGIDHHSRFVVSACVVARPVCDALEAAMARHGVPEAILTDIHSESWLDRAAAVQLAA